MAKLAFTEGTVSALACDPGKGQTIHWCTKAPGLGLRVTAAGAKAYIFQGRLHGASLRVTIGSPNAWPLKKAQTEARRLQTLIDQGIDPRAVEAQKAAEAHAERAKSKRQAATVGDAWADYLAHHEKRWGARHLRDHINLSQPSGQAKRRGRGVKVQGVLYPLLALPLASVTADLLTRWQADEVAARPNNARQGFELFRAFWRWCASRPEYAVDPQAVESKDLRAEVPARKNKRFDVLERAHLPGWFAAVRGMNNAVMSAYLQGLLLTGARREELAALRWQDVDFQWRALWIKDKVAAEGRKVPLTPYLGHLLAALPRRNEWVFSSPAAGGGRITDPRRYHNRALAAAGLPHVTLHGLRRSFASLAEWVEMPRGIVAQIMGHLPSATAEKHYINRPLELLGVWHGKYEAWILEQAGITFDASAPRLRVVV